MSDSILEKTAPSRQAYFNQQHDLLAKLVRDGQTPYAFFVTCADSRIMPESLLGAQPGDLFILRNVANIIPPYVQTEIGIVSSLEFAVQFLKVPHIIICGHTQCGGIKGLDQNIDMSVSPALSRWVDLAQPAQRDVDFKTGDLTDEERHQAIVEQNVIQQLKNLESYPFVRKALNAGSLTLHGWVYYLEKDQIGYYNPETGSFLLP